jgi:hypothetical protein
VVGEHNPVSGIPADMSGDDIAAARQHGGVALVDLGTSRCCDLSAAFEESLQREVELAGLEPATSWVRSRRSVRRNSAGLAASRADGSVPPTPSQHSAARSRVGQRPPFGTERMSRGADVRGLEEGAALPGRTQPRQCACGRRAWHRRCRDACARSPARPKGAQRCLRSSFPRQRDRGSLARGA